MAYKNWKKNYHSKRIGNKWKEEGFCDWWDFGEDWKNYNNGAGPRFRFSRVGGKIRQTSHTLRELGWRVKQTIAGVDTPIDDLTYPEAYALGEEYGRIERKMLLSAGGYRNGRKTYFKKVYNHRRRRIGTKYCNMVVADMLDEADNLDQGKDKHFGWDID